MGNRARIYLLASLAIFATGAVAQSTLGELLDTGFKKVAKGEFASAAFGTRVAVVDGAGNQFLSDYKVDGSFSGAYYLSAGGVQGVFAGTWTMDDSGKLCTDGASIWFRTVRCRFWFRNGNQFYQSDSETDRSSPIIKVTLTK